MAIVAIDTKITRYTVICRLTITKNAWFWRSFLDVAVKIGIKHGAIIGSTIGQIQLNFSKENFGHFT